MPAWYNISIVERSIFSSKNDNCQEDESGAITLVVHVNLILASSSNKVEVNKASNGDQHEETVDGGGDVAALGNVVVFRHLDVRDITVNSAVVILQHDTNGNLWGERESAAYRESRGGTKLTSISMPHSE